MKITGGELLARCLKNEGVRYVFGIPGGQLCTILDAIYRMEGIDFVMTRHESAASHMADAWSRVTGKVGVCTGTVGPGALNLVPGVAAAFADSSPILVVTPQVQSWLAYPFKGSQQELDHVRLFKPITKWNAFVNKWDRIPEIVQRAFRIATTGRPGPVHIDVPVDILFEKREETEVKIPPPERYRPKTPPAGAPSAIKEAAELLARAENPVIHAGGGVLRSGAWAEVIELAEYLGAPVSTSLSARGVIPHDHPLSLYPVSPGTFAAWGEADVVLAVGVRFGQLDFWGRTPLWNERQKLIWIDIDPEVIGQNREVDVPIVGDVKVCLAQIIEELRNFTPPKERANKYKELDRNFVKEFERLAENSVVPIHPLRLVKDVREFFPKDSLVVIDGGNIAMWTTYLCKIYEPRSFLWSADMGHLGAGLPFAIAAKLARPEKHVFIIHGDGAFMLMNQELETAKRLNLQVIDIIANDRAWGMIKAAQASSFGGRFIGVDFTDVHYDKMAESMGCYSERVEKPENIIPALERAVKSKLPAVIDVLIDANANLNPPHLAMLVGLWLEGCESP